MKLNHCDLYHDTFKEEQLKLQMASISIQRQQDHTKEIQALALENLQIKEGIESLQTEMKRIQQDKSALQERIKEFLIILIILIIN